jgi:hypothetical protein
MAKELQKGFLVQSVDGEGKFPSGVVKAISVKGALLIWAFSYQ